MYISADAGRTWTLVRHGTMTMGGPPQFEVLPDGAILARDAASGYWMSRDLREFFALPDGPESAARTATMGGLFYRRRGEVTELSVDRVRWLAFSPSAVRGLLVVQRALPVHP
jgi:hypothetical protein